MADKGPRYPLLAEEDLVSLVGEGDAVAFSVLYYRHRRAAHSLAYRMTGERQAAEDLAQEAFLKVWRGGGRLPAGARQRQVPGSSLWSGIGA